MKRAMWIVSLATIGCSSGGSSGGPSTFVDAGPTAATSSDANAPEAGDAGTEAAIVLEDFDAGPADFDCFKNSEWTAVGLSHYKNELGHTAEMLSVAQSVDGGTFPVGTIIQLNPAEAMVKRGAGFNASSNDWEFFTLDVSDAGATITARGGGSTVSNANGQCLGCHLPAQAAWDLVCGDDPDGGPATAHGCTPLPVPYSVLAAIVNPQCP
jgi:hypothetical protein